jgi:tetratricopeptide (TPR) repeat protein
MENSTNNKKYIPIGLFVFVCVLLVGFLIGRYYNKKNESKNITSVFNQSNTSVDITDNSTTDMDNETTNGWVCIYCRYKDCPAGELPKDFCSVYYNPATIAKTENGNHKVWLKFIGDKKDSIEFLAQLGIPADKYKNWDNKEELWEFNCTNQTVKTISRVDYDTNGKVIYSSDEPPVSWDNIVPNTLGDIVYAIACGTNTLGKDVITFDAGTIYEEQGNYDKAFAYYNKILKFEKDPSNIAAAYYRIAVIYKFDIKDYNKSVEYCKKALEFAQRAGDYSQMAYIMGVLGDTYIDLQDFSKAEDYLNKSLEISKKIDDKGEQAWVYMSFSRLYELQNKRSLEKEYLKKAGEIIKHIQGG